MARLGRGDWPRYSTRVKRDIARWVEQGLIDAALAERCRATSSSNERKSLSFGSVLAMMAALLFGAAILIFVAANWEAIPRLSRVAALFAIILAGYVGGAVLKTRDQQAHRRGALADRRGGVRRLDRADRPDVPSDRRRGRGARSPGASARPGRGGAALGPADRRGRRARRRLAVPAGRRTIWADTLVPASVPACWRRCCGWCPTGPQRAARGI